MTKENDKPEQCCPSSSRSKKQSTAQDDAHHHHLAQKFAADGFLCLRQRLPRPLVEPWAARYGAVAWFDAIFAQLHRCGHTTTPRHATAAAVEGDVATSDDNNSNNNSKISYALGQGVKHGFREIVMRSPGRYEISLLAALQPDERDELIGTIQEHLPFVPQLLQATVDSSSYSSSSSSSSLTKKSRSSREDENNDSSNDACDNNASKNPTVEKSTSPLSQLQQQQRYTWSDVNIINISLVVSTPGAATQGWHADGGHVSLSEHWPCHCLNIFVPLVDVASVDLGPTELRPASHYLTRNLAPMMLAARARRSLRAPVAPRLEMVDCLVFDYRLLHRGLAHSIAWQRHRPILVVAVAQPWFRDVVNFPSRSLHDS